SGSNGGEFFVKLTRSMIEATGADAGFIAALGTGERFIAGTLAAIAGNHTRANFEMDLRQIPAADFSDGKVWAARDSSRLEWLRSGLGLGDGPLATAWAQL